MKERFRPYNTHQYTPETYQDTDVHLKSLQNQPYTYDHPLIKTLPRKTTRHLHGRRRRQIGKTTLLKQWIAALIAEGMPPQSIVFFTGELIVDHIALIDLIQDFTAQHDSNTYAYIIIDEM